MCFSRYVLADCDRAPVAAAKHETMFPLGSSSYSLGAVWKKRKRGKIAHNLSVYPHKRNNQKKFRHSYFIYIGRYKNIKNFGVNENQTTLASKKNFTSNNDNSNSTKKDVHQIQ